MTLNTLKLSNDFEKLPEFHMKQPILFTVYKKVLLSNHNSTIALTSILSNPSQHLGLSYEMLWFVNIVREQMCETFPKFLEQHPCKISSHHEKYHDF
jgi:hypothetical protein